MDIGTIKDVADVMAGALRTRHRVSIIGIARLVDLDDIGEATQADVQRLVDDARELGFYPQSRAAYMPEAAKKVTIAEYEAAAIEIELGPPHNYFGAVGLGTCRDLATVDTYRLEGDDPDGVLLSDVEAVVADLLTLAYTRALHVEYRGRVDLYVDLVRGDLPTTPGLWRVDATTGETTPTGLTVDDWTPVEFSASTTATFEELVDVVRAAGIDVAHRFGVERTELIPDEGRGAIDDEIGDRQANLQRRGLRPLYEH